jgi:hypothetical protein
MKFRVFWDILTCSQIDIDIDLTIRQYIPEDSERNENCLVNSTKNVLIKFIFNFMFHELII